MLFATDAKRAAENPYIAEIYARSGNAAPGKDTALVLNALISRVPT